MLTIQTPQPAVRDAWNVVWKSAVEALMGFVAPDEGQLLQLVVNGFNPNAPNSWRNRVESHFQNRVWSRDELAQILTKVRSALVAFRAQCEADSTYFPSPAGKALLRIANEAYLHFGEDYDRLLWPTLRIAFLDSAALVLPVVGAQRTTVSFEIWVNQFRPSLHQCIERWYRPMVSTFYRLDRRMSESALPKEIFEFGILAKNAREFWGTENPLAQLVDNQIALVRNSEAHGQSEVDVDRALVTFSNRNKRGDVTTWAASAVDLDCLGRHVFHLGSLMQAVLCVVPLADLNYDPVVLAGELLDSKSRKED